MTKMTKTAKAAQIEASFIAGLEELLVSATAGGLKALRAKHTLRSTAGKPFELPLITSEAVVAARESLGVSQTVFAMILGVSSQSVRAWEQGTKPPSGAARRLIGEIHATPEHWKKRFGLEKVGVA